MDMARSAASGRLAAALPVRLEVDAPILADLQEFSYREVAEILDVPVGTVMSRLYRGRRLLQKALASYAVVSGVLQDVGDDGSIDLESYRKRRGKSA